jgi:uncharacterized protein YcfJ
MDLKKLTLTSVVLLAAVPSHALEDYARVINVQPRYQTIYQQKCFNERVESNNSTMGTIIGGVAGGIIGNQVGNGSGRDAATVIGAIVGAGVGNRIGEDQRNYEYRQKCSNEPITIKRGEIVTFEYRGRHFTVTFDY